ncbi:FxsA family protein [Nocardioides sp. CER19]|uniref:FxsA family protein n=1 Tax=Nocardioides sp. CER19 TaxID=3038538 RepID=UPI0024474EED|nr:FxsA family protein [Nocardioides sp. CER19]MDH2415656.1 FxsA family protein [Nocardioides sp. CER19]
MSPPRNRRRPAWVWAVLVAFLVVPILELWVLIQVGQAIGVGWTLILLVADSIFGTWLIKREGVKAYAALREALGSGRMPHRELADGALIVLAGALMLSPGFVTDVFGVLLLLPFTRPFGRRVLTSLVARRVTVVAARRGRTAERPGPGEDSVVRGEVID